MVVASAAATRAPAAAGAIVAAIQRACEKAVIAVERGRSKGVRERIRVKELPND